MSADFHILVVENKARDRSRYLHALAELQAIETSDVGKVSVVHDGETAWQMISSEKPPDLVVLDADLPKLSGEDVVKKTRAQHELFDLPMMILADSACLQQQVALMESGADDLIPDGATAEIFMARVQSQLRHKLTLDRLQTLAVDRDMFAAGVLHDIRNIESTIVSLCQMTRFEIGKRAKASVEKIDAYMERLEQHASRLGKYASNVIQSVRQTGEGPCIEAQDLTKLFRWIEGVFVADADGKAFTLHLPTKPEPVQGDENYLRLALLNVIQNSIKFARDEDPLTITVTQESGEKDSHGRSTIITSIRDNGRGMHPDDVKRAFQINESPARSSQRREDSQEELGFGLGLSLVAKVMSRMGGHVWAELPQDGRGTTIRFRLPVPPDHST